MMVALAALFFSLGGAAVAATAIVPLAKRALNADKLGGKTRAQVVAEAAAVPGPASSAAAAVVVKSRDATIGGSADWTEYETMCDPGQRAVSGGLAWGSGPGADVYWWDSYPTPDGGGWRMSLMNEAAGGATFKLYVVCLS